MVKSGWFTIDPETGRVTSAEPPSDVLKSMKTKEVTMPKGYEKMRDSFKKEGMSDSAAKTKAAKIWNSQHKTKVGNNGK